MKTYYPVRSSVEFSKWFPKETEEIDGLVFGYHPTGKKWNNKIYLHITKNYICLEKQGSNLYWGPELYFNTAQKRTVYKMLYHQLKKFDCYLYTSDTTYIYKKNASKMKYVASRLGLSEAELEGIWNES